MSQTTYTIRELSTLLGMRYQDVSSAKSNRNTQTVIPGTRRAAVLIGMQRLGITWDQVVKVPLGKSTNGAIPVSELLANSKEAPKEEGISNLFDSLPLLPPPPEETRSEDEQQTSLWRSTGGLTMLFDEFESDFIIAASAKGFAFIPIKMLASMHTQYKDGYFDVVFVTVSGKQYINSGYDELQNALDYCEKQMKVIASFHEACMPRRSS